ncbi:MAG: hypothetical protein IKL68_01325 [Clostridia bacterium]|nr:hypothetical protein [Clostridia bacterium]
MSIVLEVIIYIILVFGIIITTIAFMEEGLKKNERYIRVRREDAKVILTLKVEGMTKEDELLIADVIEQGKFENVYDVVDEYTLENNG